MFMPACVDECTNVCMYAGMIHDLLSMHSCTVGPMYVYVYLYVQVSMSIYECKYLGIKYITKALNIA